MWIPRLTIEISEELWNKKKRLIPHAMTKAVFTKLLSEVLDAVEQRGLSALAELLSEDFHLFNHKGRQRCQD